VDSGLEHSRCHCGPMMGAPGHPIRSLGTIFDGGYNRTVSNEHRTVVLDRIRDEKVRSPARMWWLLSSAKMISKWNHDLMSLELLIVKEDTGTRKTGRILCVIFGMQCCCWSAFLQRRWFVKRIQIRIRNRPHLAFCRQALQPPLLSEL